MSATGLETFDKSLQTTNIWLDDLCGALGGSRQTAWAVLGAVLRVIRDRVPADLAAHLGAQLPLLVRGAYYDQYQPEKQPETYRSSDEFLDRIKKSLNQSDAPDPGEAARAVFRILPIHITADQAEKLRAALPEEVRELWSEKARPETAAAH